MRESVGDGFFNLWKPVSDPSFPWTGILFGAPILGVWYWCTDQFIVQRVLSARNDDNARRGTIFAGYLKLLPLFIFVIPGIIAYALSQQGRLALEQSDQALPALIGYLMPVGLRGGGGSRAAGGPDEFALVRIQLVLYTDHVGSLQEASSGGVGAAARMGRAHGDGRPHGAGPALDPVHGKHLGSALRVPAECAVLYLPPIAAVFLLGVMWKRINAQRAIASLLAGFVLGAVRLVLELANGTSRDGLPAGSLWEVIAEFNFLHVAIVLFVLCVLVLIGVSLATSPPTHEKVQGLTYGMVEEEAVEAAPEKAVPSLTEEPRWRRRDLLLSIGLILLVGLIWLYFTG